MKTLEHLSIFLDRLAFPVKIVRFLALAGGVALVVGNYFRAPSAVGQPAMADGLFWAGGALVLLPNLLLVFIDKQAVEILRSLHEEEKRNAEMEKNLNQCVSEFEAKKALIGLFNLFPEVLRDSIISPKRDDASRREALEAAVQIIVDRKRSFFCIEDDYFNISIYEQGEAGGVLNGVECFRSHPADAMGPHRAWRSGEGYVGLAFSRRQEVVFSDTRLQDVSSLISVPPDKRKEADSRRYVSLVAAPIFLEESAPFGVIVASSDRPRRFVWESEVNAERQANAVEIFRYIAPQFAILMDVLRNTPPDEAREDAGNG